MTILRRPPPPSAPGCVVLDVVSLFSHPQSARRTARVVIVMCLSMGATSFLELFTTETRRHGGTLGPGESIYNHISSFLDQDQNQSRLESITKVRQCAARPSVPPCLRGYIPP